MLGWLVKSFCGTVIAHIVGAGNAFKWYNCMLICYSTDVIAFFSPTHYVVTPNSGLVGLGCDNNIDKDDIKGLSSVIFKPVYDWPAQLCCLEHDWLLNPAYSLLIGSFCYI